MVPITLEQITKSYGELEVVHGVDLSIDPGEFMVFVGPSGCGKSTMLRMIAGLEPITSGALRIDGRVANEEAPVTRGVAMVFQSYALYPNMTVRQNLSFGLEQARMSRAVITAKVDEVADLLKITPLLTRRPGELSGGQSQRVAIGRAIVRDPQIFLFDEPLSNLDAELRVHMRVEIKALHARLGRTTVYVTHDQVEAMTMADRIVVFQSGRIEQVGTPLDLYNAPANKFVAGFMGSPQMNFLPAMRGDTLQIAQPDAPGTPVLAGLRPEHLSICAKGAGSFDGTVLLVEQLGGEVFVYLSVDGVTDQIVIKSIGQFAPETGAVVGVHAPEKSVYLFDPETEVCIQAPPHNGTLA